MNGRCHKDPLDRADDICELCGHQFSARYLLYPRGHRNPPTCKACALQNSGLRGGSGKTALSKREYKKRKKQLLALLEAVDIAEEEAPRIEAIELSDPTPFDNSTELDRRTVDIEAPPPIDILGTAEPTPAAPAFVPPPPPAPVPEPEPAPELPHDDFGPIDTSVNPLAIDFGERPASAPRHVAPAPAHTPAPDLAPEESSAADLLARLKADQPIESQYAAPPPRTTTPAAPFEADPFAAPENDRRAATPAAAPTPMPSELDTRVDPFAPAPTATPPAPTTPAAPPSGAPAPAAPAFDASPADPAPMPDRRAPTPAPKSAPWTPPAPPPRGSNLHAMAGGPAPGEDRLDPAATPAPVPPSDPPLETPPTNSERADTDASGQWIPPSLRGMAAPEERDPLPKRR